MNKIRIAIIFGGCSSEYKVSLVSASSIIKNINKDKYDINLIGVTKEGNFYLYTGDINKIEIDEWYNDEVCQKITFSTNRSDHGFINMKTGEIVKIDLAMPIMHGKNGEDGRLQGLFELANIPCVGCDMLSSAICMDKYVAHKLAEVNGILVPKTLLFYKDDDIDMIKSEVQKLGFPVFVKPVAGGSSIGITKVKDISTIELALKEAFKYDDKVVVEENIEGYEVGCAVMGNKELIISEVDEILLNTDFFDYDTKYESYDNTSKIILPANLSIEEREKIRKVAGKLYRVLGCKDYARVDMFYTVDKKIIFNEINTIPGFTTHSRFPSMLKHSGYSFSDIIEELIKLAL